MNSDLEKEIRQTVDRIAAYDHAQLCEEYLLRFGGAKTFGDVFMRRRLAQQYQEDRLGGFTPSEIEMLSRVFKKDSHGTPKMPRKGNPGVRGVTYTREYKGKLIAVKTAGYGKFEYDGKLYDSLTAIAKFVTGTHLSGRKFFRLEGSSCRNK